ncbi:RNA-binding domain-containing protein [Paenisporosarcina sp. TG-14]|uniref:RNA-binding domain-containing protein n=1 Tax=Paenisporosarcina sp. TG-14 TaxID=1231057 RepID=UPI000304562E|nr:RNA-binding domain-containing protein [Paenisporosarcina sp. TG-14]
MNIEYKDKVTNKLYREVIAFANGTGGIIKIGMSDEKNILGLENPLAEENAVYDQLSKMVEPLPLVEIIQEHIDGKVILEVRVTATEHVYRQRDTLFGDLYVRYGSKKQLLKTADEVHGFLRLRYLDESENALTNTTFRAKDFSGLFDIIQNANTTTDRFKNMQENLEDVLASYSIIRWNNGEFVLTRLGSWLADSSHTRSVLLQYSGDRSTSFCQQVSDFSGSIVTQVSRIMTMLQTVQSLYPKELVQQSVVNAFVHRDYSIEGDVSVIIFANRMEIASPGTLIKGLSIESIKKGARIVRRNPLLHALFVDLGLTDGRGDGIRQIIDSYSDGDEKPKISVQKDSISVRLPRKEQVEKVSNNNQRTSTHQEMTHEDAIMSYLLEHKHAKNVDLQKILGVSPSRVTQIVRDMVTKNQLVAIGERKGRIYTLANTKQEE